MDTNGSEEETKRCLPSDIDGVAIVACGVQQDGKAGAAGSLGNGVDKTTPAVAVDSKPHSALPQIVASLASASFHIVMGFALAYSAILIPQLEAEGSEIPVTKTQSAWLASAVVVVVPIGALVSGVMMEYVGRLNTIKIATIPCAIGWIMLATGNSFIVLLIARLLMGIAAGLGSSPAIVYITEVAKPDLRGSLISTCPTLASLGMVLVYTEGAFLDWRTVAWTSMIYIALPIALLVPFAPESPLWLVATGRVEEADKSLRRLMGDKSALPIEQLSAMVKSQDMKALVKKNFFARLSGFAHPTGYKPLAILAVLFFFQQFSGIYITLFYAVTFFQDIGSGIDPAVSSVLVGVVRLVMSFTNTALMKRFGRRELCILSGIGMALCMTVSGFFTQYILNGGERFNWVPVACVLTYVCCSMLGLLSIPWTMTAEMFPTEIRGIAHGITTSIAHFLMFAAVQSYRDLTSLFGGAHGVQWFFAAMSLGGSMFVFLFLPETHKKKLSEIEEYFNENTVYILMKKNSQVLPPSKNYEMKELQNLV